MLEGDRAWEEACGCICHTALRERNLVEHFARLREIPWLTQVGDRCAVGWLARLCTTFAHSSLRDCPCGGRSPTCMKELMEVGGW